ncbi:MAG TPA: hypothetical protein VJY62_15070 [Bacteroidia bacterium]|nr:hypothetical protein [Bacteroidia bacterium]
MNDKLGNKIIIGQHTLAPEPNETDNYNHSFVGTVDGFRNENVVVRDGDGEYSEIEPECLIVECIHCKQICEDECDEAKKVNLKK